MIHRGLQHSSSGITTSPNDCESRWLLNVFYFNINTEISGVQPVRFVVWDAHRTCPFYSISQRTAYIAEVEVMRQIMAIYYFLCVCASNISVTWTNVTLFWPFDPVTEQGRSIAVDYTEQCWTQSIGVAVNGGDHRMCFCKLRNTRLLWTSQPALKKPHCTVY